METIRVLNDRLIYCKIVTYYMDDIIRFDRVGKTLIEIIIEDKYSLPKETLDMFVELYLSKDNGNLIILEEMLNKLEKDGFI